MYLKITSRCNMSCEHCGMNCTAKGIDMTPRIYKKAIEFVSEWSDSIAIGGGEPTLHKHFWETLALSMGTFDNVWMATNGSITETAIKLAHMAKRGIIGCALSQDIYHDPIDERVVKAFTKTNEFHESQNDYREIRDVTGREVIAGRCDFGEEECVCAGIMIEPDGEIKACGCSDAPSFGTIFTPKIPDDWDTINCHKQQENYDITFD